MIYEENYRVYRDGRIWSIRKNKYLTHFNSDGYSLVGINGKLKYVHRIVAECFIPNPLNKRTVNHKNGIKDDNTVDNLEWMTDSENQIHSYVVLGKKGHTKGGGKGNKNSQSKLTKEQILEIRASKLTQSQLARIYGVTRQNIYRIINKISWSHI